MQLQLSLAIRLSSSVTTWTVGEFSTIKFENVSVDGLNMDATSTRFNLGISWFPMLSRAR